VLIGSGFLPDFDIESQAAETPSRYSVNKKNGCSTTKRCFLCFEIVFYEFPDLEL